MERLYYETKIVTMGVVPEGTTTSKDFNEYLTKVSMLVPAEVIAGYLTMFGLVGAIKNSAVQVAFYWVVFAAGLFLTPVYMNKVATVDKPKQKHIIVSTIAFIIWAYVTTGQTLSNTIAPNIYDQAIASILLVLFSLFSAIVSLDK
jgi:hypothetical protein